MITTNPLEDDSYVFVEPYFNSVAECKAYINFNSESIVKHLYNAFAGRKIKNIYCIPEKELQKIIENGNI